MFANNTAKAGAVVGVSSSVNEFDFVSLVSIQGSTFFNNTGSPAAIYNVQGKCDVSDSVFILNKPISANCTPPALAVFLAPNYPFPALFSCPLHSLTCDGQWLRLGRY